MLGIRMKMTFSARKRKRSAVKSVVRFPAIKTNFGKTNLVESILESKYCQHLEFDPNVATYFPQPKTFKIPGMAYSSPVNIESAQFKVA